jgi:hypothetical protein
MATGNFFNALGYRFFVKAGTTGSTVPTSSTGLTEVFSLTNAGIQTKSDVTEIIDYGSPQGFKTAMVTGQTYSIPMMLNIDLQDAGYAILKNAALHSASGTTVEWYRESPTLPTTMTPEYHAGVAFVTDFSEEIQAGNVAKVSFTLSGLGAPSWTPQND